MSKIGVIITDGNERSTLAVVRSLGRRGIPVFVGAESTTSLAGASGHSAGTFTYPSPWEDPVGYVDTLLAKTADRHVAAVFPMTDIAMELIGERVSEFEALTALPIPSLDQYHQLSDKYRLTNWAETNGVPVPPTIYVPTGDIDDALAQIDQWPVIVKPGRSLLKSSGKWRKSQVMIAKDADDLRKLYHDHWFLNQPSMIQRYVEGRGEGIFGLFVDGSPKALFAHRRLRERPPSGGVSVFRESIALPESMTRYALSIMQAAKWTGVAMVEFKVDPASQTPYLMEVNGRFWGSLQLAIDAGVDFPWLLYNHALGKPETVTDDLYWVGVRSRWWLGDLDHLFTRMRHSTAQEKLPPGSISRLRTFMSLVNLFDRNTKGEVLRLSDPRPGILELGRFGRTKSVGILRKLGRPFRALYNKGREFLSNLGLRVGTLVKRNRRLPSDVKNILVLCKGNVCRSPFVEEWIRQDAKRRHIRLELSSAGLDAIEGREAYPMAKRVAPQFDLDLGHHRARQVTRHMMDQADVILVMERWQAEQVKRLFPGAGAKTFLLGHFRKTRPLMTIPDPYGGDANVFVASFDTLTAASRGFLDSIDHQLCVTSA